VDNLKINPITNPNLLRNYKTARTVPAKTNILSGRDEVTFSEEALSFSKVMTEVESRTQEERARIAGITNAVRQGEYRIDSNSIADAIIQSVLRSR
jgi:flagellar biosynthesis anti-sigma factor FlgM